MTGDEAVVALSKTNTVLVLMEMTVISTSWVL